MKTKSGGFTLVEIATVIVIVSIIAAITFPAFEKARRNGPEEVRLYQAWTKLHPNSNITYEEFRLLRRNGLLDAAPNQSR